MDKYLWFAHGIQVAPTTVLPVRSLDEAATRLRDHINKEYADWYLVTHIHHFTLLHSKAQRHG